MLFPSGVCLCNYQLNETSGTIIFPSYDNNIECTWIFDLLSISNNINFRSLQLTFRHFDTEYGHDEVFIGETISDVSKYNSKLFRFSGSKAPDPCIIPLRGSILTRDIWIQFTSDQTTTGSGFIVDYVFLLNQSKISTSKSQQILIDADIRHPLEYKSKSSKQNYTYPYGNISSPNYPENYSNNLICRWHLYHRNAFIRLYIDEFHTELHYDTLTLYLGQNLNNRAMILYEWSGNEIDNKHLFIPNDNLLLIFNTDKSNNASGFFLRYEIIEKEISTIDIYDNHGIIHSKTYPKFVRTNIEYTWNIHMNNFNEIEINLIDIDLDFDHDYLQITNGEIIYSLNSPKSFRFQTQNETKFYLRTKHSHNDYQYRGFNLTYQKLNKTIEENNQLNNLPCGKKYSSINGTIDFYFEILTSFECLMLIEVDDGQNIFLRFDDLNWDNRENFIEIGLFHHPDQYQIFHISDTLPGTWFIANDSQIWIRFSSSQYSLGMCTFRLFYSETIQWSTVSPEPYVQVLDDKKLFPYQIKSLPTNDIYHNLTQAYLWHIEAFDDECIKISFRAFRAIEDRRICFHLKEPLKITEICSDEQFPFVYHHIGSCMLSIEPEFIWILVTYDIRIEKFKKVMLINEITFKDNSTVLTSPLTLNPFLHIEWLISVDNFSMIIFDIKNVDGTAPAELILPRNKTSTQSYLLGTSSLTRFCHILYSSESVFRIIYKTFPSLLHNQNRQFHLNLYKISKNYFHIRDFYFISFQKNQSNSQWTIHGQYENSTFLANLFSSNKNLSLQTTANVNLSVTNSSISIPSSDFNIRYKSKKKFPNLNFILILYEQQENQSYPNILLNKTSAVIQTDNMALYHIQIKSTIFDSIDFILMKADNGTSIRLYDLNSNTNGYFLLNSSFIGLRFSIKSLKIKIEIQSLTKNPVQLKYKTRISWIDNHNSHYCLLTNISICKNYKNNQTCNESCSNWFNYISPSMNNTRIHHFWPYALRGSVTLIIENTTIEDFEKTISRNLRQSIAKIIRKFCLKSQQNCLSKDTNAIRSDHVIIQSYEEQLDDHRLYVALFIKDPYRQTIALTNEQFLRALKRNQYEIYQDIKHHINLPSNILEQNSLDPIWLYGVCLLALIVLIVVILMLITILIKKSSRLTNRSKENVRIDKSKENLPTKRNSHVISSPIQLASEEDEPNSSSCYNETESSQTSNSFMIPNSSPLPPPIISHYPFPPNRSSYFNSTIETAINQRLNDDEEPIPFIDDNLSTAHSRKSSACWSDRTSLSSRFSLARKLHRMRSGSQNRSNEKDKRRRHQRPTRYTFSTSQQHQSNEEL